MARARKKEEVVEEVVEESKPEAGAEGTLTEELFIKMEDEIKELRDNLGKSTRYAAAAKRARKCTTNLQKMFKEYRAASVAFWKNV